MIALTLSVVLILHAAFSLQHYRSFMQDILEDNKSAIIVEDAHNISIPVDIWVELTLGFLILAISELSTRGSMLQPVLCKGKRPAIFVAPPFVTRDFDIYETRARGLQR
jgi:Membrane magnesium transporter